MTTLALLVLAAAPPEAEFRLPNGLRTVVVADPGLPVAVVALGLLAGVHDEPEGRSGLAHLAEHAFCFGGSARLKPGEGMARMGDGGPSGRPFLDPTPRPCGG